MALETEVQALTRLGFEELGGAVAGIGRIHQAIAQRAFGASGPGATPARVAHDAVARRVYGGLRLASNAAATPRRRRRPGCATSRSRARREAASRSACSTA